MTATCFWCGLASSLVKGFAVTAHREWCPTLMTFADAMVPCSGPPCASTTEHHRGANCRACETRSFALVTRTVRDVPECIAQAYAERLR
jgi:hypothetical protein